jgi:hypothetical protein
MLDRSRFSTAAWSLGGVKLNENQHERMNMKSKQRVCVCLLTICSLAALAQVSASAQTTNAAPEAHQPELLALSGAGSGANSDSASDSEQRFQAGEWDVSPFGVYTDQAGGKWGAGAAVTYFITDKIGVGGATYWTDTGGTFFDNAEAEGYFRLPLFKRLAPYAVGSIGYQFDRQYWFETLGLGLDFRAFKRLDAFADAQYRFSNNDSKSGGGAFLRLGVRFAF